MKLFFSPNSPYARKCRIVVIEKGLESRVEFINTDPWGESELIKVNPLGTVPALLKDDGTALCDSSVICEYLDMQSTTHSLYGKTTDKRLAALTFAALAEGVIDASVACAIENLRRPADKRWPEWTRRKEGAVIRALPLLAPYAKDTGISIGTITLAVALSYVNLRIPHLKWQKDYPALASWHEAFSQRPSMEATKPVQA